jgi:RimJ/RimL family protein N-acetyltransferase
MKKKASEYFMRTDRLGFRKWCEDDIDIAFALWGDYRVTKLIDARGRLSKDAVRERLSKEIACEKEHGIQYWPIFLLATDENVGCCGLRPYDPAQGIYEIGVHIRSNHWRCGYALEASHAVIRHAFTEHRMAWLFAGHNPENDTSRHLLKKLGFRYTHDAYYPPTGLNHPSYLMRADEYTGHC